MIDSYPIAICERRDRLFDILYLLAVNNNGDDVKKTNSDCVAVSFASEGLTYLAEPCKRFY